MTRTTGRPGEHRGDGGGRDGGRFGAYGGVLDRDEIVDSLADVGALLASWLPDREPTVLVVVGGSYMALRGLRHATADVDTVTRLQVTVRDAVNVVARRRHLRPNWLNDYAEPFTPVGLRLDMCDVLLDMPSLRVLGPPPDCIFLMKLYAGRAPDVDDMVTLWPLCTFASASEAAERFVAAYPQAPPDPGLIPFIAEVAATATADATRN
jgi:hypothetical protein